MNKTLFLWIAAAALMRPCFAVETRTWLQNGQASFEKGTLTNLSLRSDGRLMLAPLFREIFDSATPYLWALARDSRGNLYAGGGGPGSSTARLSVIDTTGKARTLAEVPGMEIHSIAIDARDQVFVATSPDAKIHRVRPDGKTELFYDPKCKYIWGMVFDRSGNLFAATGDEGEIHRVTPNGQGSVFFKTEETHARSLAAHPDGSLIVGTEPGGLILRISPAGEGFVLYQAAKREVTAVAVSPEGVIFAAAVGTRAPGAAPQPAQLSIQPAPAPLAPVMGAARPVPAPQTVPLPQSPLPSIAGGSEVYRIERDNYPMKVWSHGQDIVYAIAFDVSLRPIVATGNKGNIYRIDSDIADTLLVNALPTQVTALISGPGGQLHAATGNTGKVYQIGPALEKEGSFESEAFDVGSFALWGRLRMGGSAGGGALRLETRSGNLDRPQKNWSSWAIPDAASGRVQSPSARFLQYRATLTASSSSASPEIREIEIAYMPKNVPPLVEEIEITPPNYKFTPTVATAAPERLTLPPLGQRKRTSPQITLDSGQANLSMQYGKNFAGVRWAASDPNNDDLTYRVEIRGIGEKNWKLLREKIKERHLSWDSTAYPDGEYLLRVIASDLPGNPGNRALTNQLESETFLIDNTPPQLTELGGSVSGSKLSVRWKATDARSPIRKAEYSLNGGEWMVVEPATQLSDSLAHNYTLTLDAPGQIENTIAVRVLDEFDNQTVDKVVIQAAPK